MKPYGVALAWLLVGAQVAESQPTTAGRGDFTANLRRPVAIAGHETERFSLAERMAHYRVPGVSVAVIEHCRVVDARGFGSAAPGGNAVTPRTLFQAGSITKTFTAIAALRLVQQGVLSLDRDVRQGLTSWRLPDSPLLTRRSVTLRGLLSHRAGINQEGGVGYAVGAPLPSLLDILEGRPPATNPPIRVVSPPGAAWQYSGGGYYIVQALMQDATGMAYPRLVERLVLRPLHIRDSRISQPLDPRLVPFAARAAGPDGSPLDAGWRVNPELAASGLWATPSDVARLTIAIARAARGDSHRFLGRVAARELMARGLGNWGLGVELGRPGGARRFGHTGHNTGYSSEYVMYPDSCQGAFVMTNADEGVPLASELLRAIGDTYGWPERVAPTVQAAIPLTETIAARFVGTYRLRDFPAERFVISRRPGGLYWARAGHVGRDLMAQTEGRLFSPDSRMTLEVADLGVDRAQTLSLSFGGGTNVAERVRD